MVSPLLDEKKQRLDLHVLFEGLVIDGDADRLSQVISNLLTNASKYSGSGTTIRVTAVAVAIGPGSVCATTASAFRATCSNAYSSASSSNRNRWTGRREGWDSV